MNLTYKASSVAKAEQEFGLKFFDVFTQIGDSAPGMAEVVFLLRAGGASDDEADALVAEKGIDGVFVDVLEGMKQSGFLGSLKIDTEKVRKDLAKVRQEVSPSSGEPKSA